MLFTSTVFLFLYLPITLLVHFLLPFRFRNVWLLLASLFFYAWGEPVFVLAMLASIVFNYFAALLIEKTKEKQRIRRLLLYFALTMNLGLLFVYKYMNFVTANLHAILPASRAILPQTHFVLPIGISFFTFQALSYVVDVYRGIPAQKKPVHMALFIAFFPQLIAGPIVRYTTIREQLERREITMKSFSQGVLRFLYGFNKKMLLANMLAEVADMAFTCEGLSVAMAWLGAISYTLQIYFDFSGYSEMAIGLGLMFGFRFLENFHYPYVSKTITEFWRRWHISLGSWFRDYVYFPMGGSRVSNRKRLYFNLAVVWLATGIWHGASWNFILWGIFHGCIVMFEKAYAIPEHVVQDELSSFFYRLFTLLCVVFGWVLFRAAGLSHAIFYFKSMFALAGGPLLDDQFLFYLREYAVFLVFALLCSTPLFSRFSEKLAHMGHNKAAVLNAAGYVLQFLLFVVGVSLLAIKTHNPFIYFNF